MNSPSIDNIRDMFDYMFLDHIKTSQEEITQTLQATGLEGLSKIIEKNKRNSFFNTARPLIDLTQVSMFLYSTLDHLPITKKLELPEEDGNYKFIIAGVNTAFDKETGEKPYMIMLATKQGMHKEIYDGLAQRVQNPSLPPEFSEAIKEFQIKVIGGGRIKIDRATKSIQANQSSGHFGTLSNELVEWFLEEHEKDGYNVDIDMHSQGKFFEEID